MHILRTKVTYMRSQKPKISPQRPQSVFRVNSKRLQVLPKRAKGVPRDSQSHPGTPQKPPKMKSKTTSGDFLKNDRLQVAKTPLCILFLKGRFAKTPLFTTFSWAPESYFFENVRKHHPCACFRRVPGTCLSKGTGSALKRRKFPKHYSTLLDPCTEQCTNSLNEFQGDSKSHNKWPPYVEMHPLWDPKEPKVTLKAPKVIPRTPKVLQSDPPGAQSVPKVSPRSPKVFQR